MAVTSALVGPKRIARPDRDRPCELQIGDVVPRHLIERAVAVAVARSPPAQPVPWRRVREPCVGHRGQRVRHLLVDEPRRSPPQPLAHLRRAARLGDVRRVADRHPRIRGQGALTRHGAVRLQQVSHQIHVGRIAERAGLPWRHLVAQVGEQLIGRLSRPTVQEIYSVQMCGWFRLEMVFASRSNRCFRSGSEATCSGSTLTATVQSSLVSRALHTSPMPPAPMAETISYGPSCRPASSGIVQGLTNAVQAGVAGFVDLTHASCTNGREDLVRAERGAW